MSAGTGVDALRGLKEGNPVVVHEAVERAKESALEVDRVGKDGLRVTEGVVAEVNQAREEITIISPTAPRRLSALLVVLHSFYDCPECQPVKGAVPIIHLP